MPEVSHDFRPRLTNLCRMPPPGPEVVWRGRNPGLLSRHVTEAEPSSTTADLS